MGRSVSYPHGALVAFTHVHDEDDTDDCAWLLEFWREMAQRLWPSLREVDTWRGREDHVIARNGLVEFGVSEYCGLVAIWLVERTDLDTAGQEALATQWIKSVAPRFRKTFGTLRKVGTFSNGEGIFERVAA